MCITGNSVNREMDILPKTINESAAVIFSEMSGRDKLRLRNTKKDDLILFHMSWGQEIRNKFGLYASNGELAKDAKADHPDSVSTVIMNAVWEELQIQ
jgi:hypothetical protein